MLFFFSLFLSPFRLLGLLCSCSGLVFACITIRRLLPLLSSSSALARHPAPSPRRRTSIHTYTNTYMYICIYTVAYIHTYLHTT